MDPIESPGRLPPARAVTHGLRAFVLVSLIGLVLGLYWKAPGRLPSLLADFDGRWVPILIALLAADALLGGLRFRSLLNGRILPAVPLATCVRANWANIFMGAVTPFQTGGGPAQLYVLWRAGLPLADGLLASLVSFAATLALFLIGSTVTLIALPSARLGGELAAVVHGAVAVVALVSLLVLTALHFPRAGFRMLGQGLARPARAGSRLAQTALRQVLRAERGAERLRNDLRSLLRHGRGALAAMLGLTALLLLTKFTIGYVLARALGAAVPYGLLVGLQTIQMVLIYFAPTPGASGLAEFSTLWLFNGVLPGHLLLAYTVLWRLCGAVFGAALGGWVLLGEARRRSPLRVGEPSRQAAGAGARWLAPTADRGELSQDEADPFGQAA